MTEHVEPKSLKPLPLSDLEALSYRWERPSEIARELMPLVQSYALELKWPPFDIDWDRIFALERADQAAMWTARTPGGALVGYMFATAQVGMFSGRAYTKVEAGYMLPAWRSGWTAVHFLRSGVQAIAQTGSRCIEWGTNDVFEPDEHGRSRLAKLLERIGFEQTGTVMVKVIHV